MTLPVSIDHAPRLTSSRRLAWQDSALCAETNPDAFVIEKGCSTRDAKKVCAACPVAAQCLEYALANNERFGVWGGLSERERRALLKERAA
jgi:WhiB family redox-sensing transcriptional regulator